MRTTTYTPTRPRATCIAAFARLRPREELPAWNGWLTLCLCTLGALTAKASWLLLLLGLLPILMACSLDDGAQIEAAGTFRYPPPNHHFKFGPITFYRKPF